MMRRILIGILGVLVILQFFRGTPPETSSDNPGDLIVTEQIQGEVSGILKTACYDCHSNETTYPWYTYITPVSWFVFDHVEHGREELNFSEWTKMEKRRKIRKLKEISEEVEEGEMPLSSYTIIHGDASLFEDQKEVLIKWAESFAEETMKK